MLRSSDTLLPTTFFMNWGGGGKILMSKRIPMSEQMKKEILSQVSNNVSTIGKTILYFLVIRDLFAPLRLGEISCSSF